MPYKVGIYSFQDSARAAAAAEGMNAMERDGWVAHTAMPNFNEVSVLWHKPLVTELSVQVAGQLGEVHCPGCTCMVTCQAQDAGEPVPE
jgi:hypothetical protein